MGTLGKGGGGVFGVPLGVGGIVEGSFTGNIISLTGRRSWRVFAVDFSSVVLGSFKILLSSCYFVSF